MDHVPPRPPQNLFEKGPAILAWVILAILGYWLLAEVLADQVGQEANKKFMGVTKAIYADNPYQPKQLLEK